MSRTFPIPGRLNLVLTAAQVATSLGLLLIASSSGPAVAALAIVAFAFVMQMGFSLIHEAEHGKLHGVPWINDAAGFVLAAIFPGSYQFMKVAHLAHHRRNRADVELVDYIRPGERAWVKTAQYYLLICGLIWVGVPLVSLLISVVPWSVVGRRLGQGRDEREGGALNYLRTVEEAGPWRVRLETAATVGLWVLAFAALDLSAARVGLAYAAFAFSWASQQYIYHVRTPRHLIEGAFNLRLWRPVELLYLQFNHHLTHHRAPNVPWLYMRELDTEPATRGYLTTYVRLWAPPEPVSRAFPIEFQAHGPLPESRFR